MCMFACAHVHQSMCVCVSLSTQPYVYECARVCKLQGWVVHAKLCLYLMRPCPALKAPCMSMNVESSPASSYLGPEVWGSKELTSMHAGAGFNEVRSDTLNQAWLDKSIPSLTLSARLRCVSVQEWGKMLHWALQAAHMLTTPVSTEALHLYLSVPTCPFRAAQQRINQALKKSPCESAQPKLDPTLLSDFPWVPHPGTWPRATRGIVVGVDFIIEKIPLLSFQMKLPALHRTLEDA